MFGYSAKLPLKQDQIDGLYSLNKTLEETIKQNFKMLLLTNPGERVMLPDYGVGLRQMLFDQSGEVIKEKIISKITSQLDKYLSIINLIGIEVNDGLENNPTENLSNTLNVRIYYNIPYLNVNDELNMDLSSN